MPPRAPLVATPAERWRDSGPAGNLLAKRVRTVSLACNPGAYLAARALRAPSGPAPINRSVETR